MDVNGNEVKQSGLTILKNVEFFKMGQKNTFKSAIRFENSMRLTTVDMSSIENVSVHDSDGVGIYVLNSQNISMKNSDVFNTVQFGVMIDQSTNIVADSVNVFNVVKNASDKEGCVAICS